MPLNGCWSGRCSDVRLTCETVYHFPEDKKVRDSVHARLAKKIAAREARKARQEQSAGVSTAGYGQRQENGQRGKGEQAN
jgi:hypothetical protein